MQDTLPPATDRQDKLRTLSDGDISAQRFLSRRSLLATLGVGAGVAAAAFLLQGTASVEAAARSKRERRLRIRQAGGGPGAGFPMMDDPILLCARGETGRRRRKYLRRNRP